MTKVSIICAFAAAAIVASGGIFLNRKRLFPGLLSSAKKLNCVAALCCLGLVLFMGGLCLATVLGTSHSFDAWHLNVLKADQIWKKSTGDSQTIAFIDTGIDDALADELGNRISFFYNVIDDSDDVTDNHGHGTEMISICCGTETEQCIGIAPKAKLIVLKAVSDDGKTDNKLLLKALQFAEAHAATVVNISLGGFQEDEEVSAQITKMVAEGITVVCAVGDYGNKDFLFPASVEGVIPVAAIDENKKPWSKNNTSDKEVFYMPGVDIISMSVNQGKLSADESQGTSCSAALMSGYVALLRDYYGKMQKSYDNSDIMEAIREVCVKPLKPFK